MDAVTLRRDLLNDNNNLTRVERNKTATGSFVPQPPAVAEMLPVSSIDLTVRLLCSRVFVDEIAVHPFENEFPHLR